MNSFFRKLPLPVKLMLISLVPLALMIYLALQFYIEKTRKIDLLGGYMQGIHQSSSLTRLIDALQEERQYSWEYTLHKDHHDEIVPRRRVTDSVIYRLEAEQSTSLFGFPQYTFLDSLQPLRRRIDQGLVAHDQVMHYYTNMIFRLNTLNNVASGNNAYLSAIYTDLNAQKLLSEMVTYLGIMGANVYNALYTRQYMVETLMGTQGVHDVYHTYEREFLLKSSPQSINEFVALRNTSELKPTLAYLHRLFSTYKFDSTYTYQQWDNTYTAAIEKLRHMQQKLLAGVEERTNAIYNHEQQLKQRTLWFIVAMFLLCLSIVVYTVHVVNQMLNELKVAAQKISKGSTGLELKNESNDAIGSLAESILHIDRNNQYLVQAADAIGRGQFDFPFHPRSNEDVLGQAILRMKESLQAFTRELQQREHQFHQLADALPQLVWTARPDGYVDYYNRKWYDFTGFEEQYGDQSWMPILHPDDVPTCLDKWYHSVRTGEPFKGEYRFKDHRTGTYRWFLCKALPLKDEEGVVVKWFGTCTDIHERKTTTEQLEILVEQRTEELRRSNEDLQQFAHIASHDLKEPLRKVMTFGSRLNNELGDTVSGKGSVYLNKMIDAAMRMTRMVDGVLHYSTLGGDGQPTEVVDLTAIIEGIRSDLEVVIQQKQAAIVYNSLPQVKGVSILLHQLFYNLINNSLKFARPGTAPLVHITARRVMGRELKPFATLRPDTVYEEITVKDNGIGFDAAYSEKVFDVFARLNSYDKYEGTGLGLSLCKKITLRHKGYIYANGVEGQGATFTIVLPVEGVGAMFG